jgi:assimilatory nitrate reductase catalytic subunit
LQLEHKERLTDPLIRKEDGSFRKATWNEALDVVAAGMKQVREKYGPSANAMFGSGALSNETVYLLGKFARLALGTPNIDYNGRYCMSSAAAAQNAVFGMDRGLHFPLADLALSRVILIAGANVGDCLPPILVQLRKAKKEGAKIIVADPRGHATSRLADLHLALKPGSDLALANALLHELAVMHVLDWDFLKARTSGFNEALEAVQSCSPEWAAKLCGIPAEQIRETARMLAGAKPALILTARGVEQHAKGPEMVMGFINVALGLGQVGIPGGGFGTLTGQGNGQGGREHGQKADQLPGYRSIEDPKDRAAVAAAWGVDEKVIPGKGLSAQELFQASHRSEIRSMWVIGSNPAVSAAKGGEVAESLAGLDFLAVSDLFFSETCRLAHVVFPATAFAEEDGTMTNIEGRVIVRRAALRPRGEARPDWRALCDVAARLGCAEHFAFHRSEQVFDEFARVTKGGRADYSGLSYAKLERNKGVFWPCPTPNHAGTTHLFAESFRHADGRAHMRPTPWRVEAEEPDERYPLRLTSGRVLEHYLSGNQTRRLEPLVQAQPKPFVEMNPALAERLSLKEGQSARVSTRRGSLVLPVRLNDAQREDTLFVPMHWGGEESVNRLTLDALSPISKMPEFKHCAASLEAA